MLFNIGDVVYLKSEDKRMTVINCFNQSGQQWLYVDNDTATCAWMDKYDCYQQVSLPFSALEKRVLSK